MHLSLDVRAKLACAYCGAIWGLFWIPLRWLESAGVEGPWISVVFFAVAIAVFMPVMTFRMRHLARGGPGLWITCALSGSALALYAISVVYTDVIRAMLLFYLTPMWSTLLARFVLAEPITRIRWLAMLLAFAGMLVIFGADIGVPLPRNLGDWIGLASGMLWSVATVRLRQDRSNRAVELTFGFLFCATLVSLAGALLPLTGNPAAPDLDTVAAAMPWLLVFALLAVIPGSLAAHWGPKHIDPGIVGILFMTEITVGAITVAIWAGEPFGLRELLGVILITAAGLLESVISVWKNKSARTRQRAA